jgi:catechol 1,2-dioxygenase
MKVVWKRKVDRREFISTSALVAVAIISPGIISCKEDTPGKTNDLCSTTADILGPFYKAGAPFREDIIPAENTAEPLVVRGKVFDGCNGELKNAIVEIWNANHEGVYDNTTFRFRGSYETNDDGNYRFKTIIPGRYLNGGTFRPSHIHFRITAPDHQELVSQIYFKDDPFINSDPWASNASASQRILVIEKDTSGIDTITFDIHLPRLT